MKKLLLLIGLICCIGSVSAQTKTAYCDVYMRGGYDCMTVTLMYDSNSHRLNRSYSMGEILNIIAEDGWVLDNDIVIPRHPLYSFFTRHKLHLIMKKEYNTGENPFAFIKDFCSNKGYIDNCSWYAIIFNYFANGKSAIYIDNKAVTTQQSESEPTYDSANLKEMIKRRDERRIKTDSLNNLRKNTSFQ